MQRGTSIGTSICLEGADKTLMCSAGHTRGHLEQAEEDAALALCQSLTITP